MDATYDDGSCAYEFDCLGECGGMAVEDCLGVCDGDAVEDCLGVCNGTAEYDCAGACDGTSALDACGVCGGDAESEDECGSCVDIDGNSYETIQIGEQEWMAENLKVTHYNNGDAIPTGYSNSEWVDLDETETGAYAIYDDDPANAEIYGNLYNWYTVDDDRGVCPEGWHVPSDDEYTVLTDYLGGTSVAGGKMKEAGLEHWNSPNTGATNESGFTGLPAGYRNGGNGDYYSMGDYGYFWSSTEGNSNSAWYRKLDYDDSEVNRFSNDERSGFSLRCLRD